MRLFDLAVGIYKIGLVAWPIISTFVTVDGYNEHISVLLLWTFQYLKCIGYSVLGHYFGTEADIYLLALAAFKTMPFVKWDTTACILWSITLAWQLAFIPLQHTGLAPYIDEWRFTRSQEQDYDNKHSRRRKKARVVLREMGYLGVGLLLGASFLFNALKLLLIGIGHDISYGLAYGGQSADASYSSTTGETVAIVSACAETIICAILVVRIPGLTRKTHQETSDFWQGAGALFMAYVYYNIVIINSLGGSLFIITITQVIVLPIALGVVDSQVTPREDQKWASYLFEEFTVAIQDFFYLLLIEPALEIIFILLYSMLINYSSYRWYSTHIEFSGAIRDVACYPLYVIEHFIRIIFEVTNDPDIQRFFLPISSDVSLFRIYAARIISTVYDDLVLACRGGDVDMIPLYRVITMTFLLVPSIIVCMLILQVFPLVEKKTRRSMYWAIALALCSFTLFATQCASDINVVLYWFFVKSEVTRTYSWTGVGTLIIQILLCIICIMMYVKRHKDENIRKSLGISGPFGIDLTNLKNIPGMNIVDAIVSPGALFFLAAIAMGMFAVLQGNPFDNVNIARNPWKKGPAWMTIGPYELIGQYSGKLVKIMAKKYLMAVYAVAMIPFLINQIPCFSIPGYTGTISIGGQIINGFQNPVDSINSGFNSFKGAAESFGDMLGLRRRLLEIQEPLNTTIFLSTLNEALQSHTNKTELIATILGSRKGRRLLSGDDICLGQLLGHHTDDFVTLVLAWFEKALDATGEHLEGPIKTVLGPLYNLLNDAFDSIHILDKILRFNIFEIDLSVDVFRIPVWLPYVAIITGCLLVVAVIAALVKPALKPFAMCMGSVYISMILAAFHYAITIKSWLDTWAFGLQIDYNYKIFWYLLSFLLGILSCMLFFFQQFDSGKSDGTKGKLDKLRTKNPVTSRDTTSQYSAVVIELETPSSRKSKKSSQNSKFYGESSHSEKRKKKQKGSNKEAMMLLE